MRLFINAAATLLLGLFSAHGAITITGFGSSQPNPFNLDDDLQDNWAGTGSLTASALSIVGATNITDGANGIYSDLTIDGRAPVAIGASTATLSLTGTLTSATPGTDKFSILLYDENFNSLVYIFNWSSFQGGGVNGVSVNANLFSQSGAFDGTVASWQLKLSGIPGDSPSVVGMNFNSLRVAAVPEPATCALVLASCGILGLTYGRRRVGLFLATAAMLPLGAPADVNAEAKQLAATGLWKVDASTGGGEKGMPPGSIFLYVFEGAEEGNLLSQSWHLCIST